MKKSLNGNGLRIIAFDYGSGGLGFDSLTACHLNIKDLQGKYQGRFDCGESFNIILNNLFLTKFKLIYAKEYSMLSWIVIFLVIALIAGLLGFSGIAGAAAGIAQILFFVFLVLLAVALLARAMRGRPPI